MKTTRLQCSVRATIAGMVTNAVLAGVKLTAGLLGNSYALVADAIESFSDIASSIIVWRGVVVAARPADTDHPYGHGRAETLATATVSVMLIGAALLIFVQSLKEVFTPHHSPAPFTLYVLLGVVLVKEILYRFVDRVGQKISSGAVQADAWHHRSDAITSAAAAIGISVALIGGEEYKSADDIAAIFAAGLIAWNGWRLLRPAVRELMDEVPDAALIDAARCTALEIAGVQGVEKCFARKMGYTFVFDMHMEVESTMTVAEAHALAHLVKDTIRAKYPRISDVAIHIEPFPQSPS